MTKSYKKRQTEQKARLTERQLKAIPAVVACSTISQGCRKAKLHRGTFYEWLKNPDFKAELDRQRDEVASEAFNVLSQALTEAVETLTGLLTHEDDRLRRLAAKDIVEYFLRHKETKDLLQRVEAIEDRLTTTGRRTG